MKIDELTTAVKDTLAVRRVYADPYERDGLTVIPAARVAGAAGGGGGTDAEHQAAGEGGGFAVRAWPTGAYVIRDGNVRWQPAVDVNRLFAVVGGIVIAALLTRPRVHKVRIERRGMRLGRKARRAEAKHR